MEQTFTADSCLKVAALKKGQFCVLLDSISGLMLAAVALR